MRERLRHYWQFVQSSLWFVPSLMCITGVALAVALLVWGTGLIEDSASYWILHTGDVDNARELMSALLSGMITMSSLVISITMVVLTLAAGQIGPRLIRNFIQDRVTQTVLGFFLADILYLLVVFRSVDNGNDAVPHLAVTVGTVLTAASMLVLLFYVHRLARSIIYDNFIQSVAVELRSAIRHLLPEEQDYRPPPYELGENHGWIDMGRDGYIQSVNHEALVDAACKADAVIRLHVRPGIFVLSRGEHVALYPAAARTDEVCRQVRDAFIIGSERVPTQDIEFGFRQLVEIAARALSPGLNDVFTAVAVIDNISAGLTDIFARGLQPSTRRDRNGALRLVLDVADYSSIVGEAFDQIRHSGRGNPAILLRLADAISRLAPCISLAAQRRPVLEQLDMILDAAERNIATPRDLAMIRAKCQEARNRLVQG